MSSIDESFYKLAIKERDYERQVNERLRAEVERLTRERDEARNKNAKISVENNNLRIEMAMKESALSAEVETLQEDARRWRMLRKIYTDMDIEREEALRDGEA